MAESVVPENKKLHDIFVEGWNLFEDLEKTSLPFSSVEYQKKVKDSIAFFEESTKIVNEISMFSSNELIDEVPTEHLQYLLLPFFLGQLTTKLSDSDRMRLLELAEIYYNDYLQRCSEYELTEAPKKSDSSALVESNGRTQNELESLMNAAHSRNDKIAQFRKKKALDEQINLLREAVRNESVDDEIKRDFFMNFLNRSIIDSREELNSLKMEKQMVQMRMAENSTRASSKPTRGKAAPPRPPMKPFIITRDDTQKAVFGMGYPSLPVMTVGEFYHQRVHDGIFPNEEQVQEMNKQQLLARMANPDDKEDEEKAAIEVLAEIDDPDYLQRTRAVDEYKDVVRRGDGNRHNRS